MYRYIYIPVCRNFPQTSARLCNSCHCKLFRMKRKLAGLSSQALLQKLQSQLKQGSPAAAGKPARAASAPPAAVNNWLLPADSLDPRPPAMDRTFSDVAAAADVADNVLPGPVDWAPQASECPCCFRWPWTALAVGCG